MASPHLHHAGTPAQKARYMPGITAGRTITAVGITEPGAGSDVAGLRTHAPSATATTGCSNGSKLFITNGVHADLYFIAARTGHGAARDLDLRGREGHAGLSRRPRAGQDRLAARPTPPSCISTNCRMPADHLLGEEGKGFYAVMKNFQTERIALGADGGRPLHAGAAADAGARAHAPGLRRHAVGQAGGAPAAGDARRQDTRRARSTSTTAPGASRRGTTWCRTCRCSRR